MFVFAVSFALEGLLGQNNFQLIAGEKTHIDEVLMILHQAAIEQIKLDCNPPLNKFIVYWKTSLG
ncbi:hypothetical protein [Alteromonas sp. BMJM2]|uniref:hypothetical protein n=1 Tax=Alteromonas sp. BMJM2 TaxID=2954241 RepID=UPI0022B5CDC9|nr:hypothetical protein [Alteromonas sp. BMJM2]